MLLSLAERRSQRSGNNASDVLERMSEARIFQSITALICPLAIRKLPGPVSP